MEALTEISSAGANAPALEVRGLRKSFLGVTVLHGVDLRVSAGSVHALVGHNGSGKSTLIKALAGFHELDESVDGRSFGRSFRVGRHDDAASVGLRFVHQDLGLVDEMSVVDNLALGTGYPVRGRTIVRQAEATSRAETAMTALGYDVDVRRPVGTLSPSEKTGVAIARALEEWTGTPSVVVLDEPTASMPAPEVGCLFDAVRRLRERGLGVIYVSHHLDEVLEIADDVTVLRGGRVAMVRPSVDLTHDELVTAIVGHELAPRSTQNIARPSSNRPVALEVRDLATATVAGLDLVVAAGEIVGVAGIVGSGRHDVLPAIAGDRPRGGQVRIGGRDVRPHSPRAAIASGLGFVPADRRVSAVLPTFDVARNLTASGMHGLTRFGFIQSRREEREARTWLQDLGVLPSEPASPILTLSGGNQQKVMVGRWVRRRPVLLALDEPTQGVDVGAKQSIYSSLRSAAEAGQGVLISSSDSEELAAVADRVLVLSRGAVIAELAGDNLNAERIDALSLGEGTGIR